MPSHLHDAAHEAGGGRLLPAGGTGDALDDVAAQQRRPQLRRSAREPVVRTTVITGSELHGEEHPATPPR